MLISADHPASNHAVLGPGGQGMSLRSAHPASRKPLGCTLDCRANVMTLDG